MTSGAASPPTLEPPLVTFLIIFYNQEEFAEAAARSALAQDYPRMQIVLSDDCSPDGTFKVLQRIAADYDGPHQLHVRQPPRNLGLFAHFFDAARLAEGALVVVGGGDDISYPGRVTRLVAAWRESGADALCSDWDVIDSAGALIRHGRGAGQTDLRVEQYFPNANPVRLTGATAAYSADVFRHVPVPPEPLFAEDSFLTLMLGLFGRTIVYVPDRLVAYRTHARSATHTDSAMRDLAAQERWVQNWSGRTADMLRLVETVAKTPPATPWGQAATVNASILREDIHFNLLRARWYDLSIWQRLRAFAGQRVGRHRRWMATRLFGLRGLSAFKTIGARIGRGA